MIKDPLLDVDQPEIEGRSGGFWRNAIFPVKVITVLCVIFGVLFLASCIGMIVLAVKGSAAPDCTPSSSNTPAPASSSSSSSTPGGPIVFDEFTAECFLYYLSADGGHKIRGPLTREGLFASNKWYDEVLDEDGNVTMRTFAPGVNNSVTICSVIGNHPNCYTVSYLDDYIHHRRLISTQGLELDSAGTSCYALFDGLEYLLPNRKLDKCDYYHSPIAISSSSDTTLMLLLESGTNYPVLLAAKMYSESHMYARIFTSFKAEKPQNESSLLPFPDVTVYDFRDHEGNCDQESTFVAGTNVPESRYDAMTFGFQRSHFMNAKGHKVDPSRIRNTVVRNPESIPDQFDARTEWPECESVIGTITRQSPCGSCWAMASSGVLADRMCIAKGVKQQLSPQYMVYCGTETNGCYGGGDSIPVWEQLMDKGTVSEQCIPFAGRDGYCPMSCSNGTKITKDMLVTVKGIAIPWNNTPETLVQAIQTEIMTNGPVITSFLVFSDFDNYYLSKEVYHRSKDAVFTGSSHLVRIIGWGTTDKGEDYWLVANSWGISWGEKGFFKIRRGINECNCEEEITTGLI